MVVVEWESKNDKKTTKVRVEPFRIVLNDETMDKLRIFRDVNGRSSVQPYFAVNRNVNPISFRLSSRNSRKN